VPAWLGWTLALLTGTLIMPAVSRVVLAGLERLAGLWPARYGFALAVLLAGLIFWLARLRHLRWGDSYMLSVLLSYPELEQRVIYNWQAPLTVFLHQRLWQFVADPLLGWPVVNVYATISILCGVVFVYVLLTFTARLGRSRAERATLAGLLLTTGSMELFFGYVENYTIISLGLLITLFLAWRALRGEVRLLWPMLAFALTNAFHPSTVFLWPAMGVLVWFCRRRLSWPGGLATQVILPPLLVGVGVLALMEHGGHGLSALLGADRPGGGDAMWFVPLFAVTTEWQRYTMFSAAHLLDWANLHFLLAPFGLPLLALLAAYRRLYTASAEREYAYFLGAFAAAYVLFTWLWNADYGMQKDWDLFAPSAFVYALLVGYLLVRALPDQEELRQGGLFVVAVSLLHTAAWVFANTHVLPRG
jgi:hypothetical protein